MHNYNDHETGTIQLLFTDLLLISSLNLSFFSCYFNRFQWNSTCEFYSRYHALSMRSSSWTDWLRGFERVQTSYLKLSTKRMRLNGKIEICRRYVFVLLRFICIYVFCPCISFEDQSQYFKQSDDVQKSYKIKTYRLVIIHSKSFNCTYYIVMVYLSISNITSEISPASRRSGDKELLLYVFLYSSRYIFFL